MWWQWLMGALLLVLMAPATFIFFVIMDALEEGNKRAEQELRWLTYECEQEMKRRKHAKVREWYERANALPDE